jgi:hypothetical protein
MRPVAPRAAVALLALACGTGTLGTAERSPAATAGVGGRDGDIEITGAYLGGGGAAGGRLVFLTIHDVGQTPDLLEAVIAPLARSTTWTVTRAVHTQAEVEAFAEPCSADPRLLEQSIAELAASSDVVVPARGWERLSPGAGWLRLNGLGTVDPGAVVAMTLYFASGAAVRLDVPAGSR